MQSKSFKRSKNLEIKKIAIFFNNKRGLKITNYLKSKNYLVYNIITKKFINKSILNSVKRENTIFINNLNNKKLIFFLKKEKYDVVIIATNHSNLRKKLILQNAKKIFDTRGVYKLIDSKKIINI